MKSCCRAFSMLLSAAPPESGELCGQVPVDNFHAGSAPTAGEFGASCRTTDAMPYMTFVAVDDRRPF
jgi:hypothetical protein